VKDTQEAIQTPWLLTVAEVAEISRQTDKGIRLAIREGRLVASRQAPERRRAYLVTRQALADWLGIPLEDVRSRCSTPTPGDEDAA